MQKSFGWLTVLCAVVVFGCGGTDKFCKTGAEGCDCYGNKTCNSGLACKSDLCVNLGDSGAAGSSGSGGKGGKDGSGAAGAGTGGAGGGGGGGGASGSAAAAGDSAITDGSVDSAVTDGSGDGKKAKGKIFEECIVNDDCEEGLLCAGPTYKKLCNILCTGNEQCDQRFVGAVCLSDGYCHILCETSVDCPSGLVCGSLSTPAGFERACQ